MMLILSLRDCLCDQSIPQPKSDVVVTYFDSVGITLTEIKAKAGMYIVEFSESTTEEVQAAWAAFDGTIKASETVALAFDLSKIIKYREIYKENPSLAEGMVSATLDAVCNLALQSLGIPQTE